MEYDINGFAIVGDLPREEVVEAFTDLRHKFDILRAENNAITLTMNKFLAKDHPEVLQGLLESCCETEKKY